jgi:hypothetical protein
MSVWDWVETGLANNHVELPAMTGSFGVTIGDAVSGFFGARHTHIFGPDIKLVADPEDMLMGKLEHFLPGVAQLLAGVGGNVTFCYGTNLTATYVGPKMEIRRAPTISKTTDYVLPRVKASGPVTSAGVPPVDPVDEAMLAAVAALSVLVICVPAALELAIRFKYPAYGSKPTTDEQKETIEGYGNSPGVLKLCAYMVTSRLMALLKMLEDKGSWAQFAEQWIKEAEYLGVRLGVAALACIPLYGWYALLVMKESGSLKNALESTTKALEED